MAKIPGFLREVRVTYKTKRATASSPQRVRGPQAMVNLFRDLQEETKEKLVTISFDKAHKILCFEVAAIGGTNACHARPIEIFKSSFLTGATFAMVLHNHSTGDFKPSISDVAFTKRILDVSETIGLKLIDHILIGYEGFYSFASQGRLSARFQ